MPKKSQKARLPMEQVLRLRQGGRHSDGKKVSNKKAARGRTYKGE